MHFLTLDKEITNARKKKILSGLSKEELFNILQFSKDDYSTFTNRRTEISDDFQRFLENLQGQKISSCSENYNTNSSDSWLDFKDQFFKYDESDKHFHNCNFLSLLPFGNCYHPIISFVNSLLKEGNSSAEQVFSKKAELSFLKYLSEKLSKVCSRVLMFEFKSRQSINDIFFNQFDLEHNSNVDYLNFEIFVIGDRWKTFFLKYPILERFVFITIKHCLSEILDIERAFTNDKIILKDFFNQQFNLEFIDDIIFGMSEPHDDGKSVCKIVFEPGLNLIYKPRSVNIDCAFYDLLTWIESKNNLPKQYKRKILAKNDYGWCEYIEYQQLNTLREAENYFERCGGLLAIIYFLHGNDFHHENIVAFGEYPVLIDLETIYQPVINLFKNENTNSSIFSSHFLPKKYIIKGVEMDITGLGYNSKTVKPTLTFQWKNLNTDKIKLTLSLYKNYNSQSVPKHLDKEQTVEDYEVNFLRGFDSIYNSLLDNRENLIATNGPLDQLFFCKARFVFRSSDLYRGIFTRVFLAQSLKEERQAFREISLVKRFFKENTDNSHLVLATLEMVSMWFLDYPRFEFNGFSDELKTNLLSCKGFFMMSVANQIKNRILSLDSNDLLIQSDIIKLAFVERRLKND